MCFNGHVYPVTDSFYQHSVPKRAAELWAQDDPAKEESIWDPCRKYMGSTFGKNKMQKRARDYDDAEPGRKKGRQTNVDRFHHQMSNPVTQPLLNVDPSQLDDPEHHNKYLCYTDRVNLNTVYDTLIRQGIVPQGTLAGGRGLTKWFVDSEGHNRKCTQIATSDQLITVDPHLETNVFVWRVYCNPEKQKFSSRMPGVWGSLLFGMKLPYRSLPVNREHRRPAVPEGTRCSLCGRSADVPFELDHVQPFCSAGEGGELQWTCARCNHRKSNQLQGYKLNGDPFLVQQNLRNLLSEFSNHVLFNLVEDKKTCLGSFRPSHCYLSEKDYQWLVDNPDDYEILSVDICKQYSTATYLMTHAWPQFSKLDFVEEYTGQDLKPGAYFVTRFCGLEDLTWEGERWYLEPWVSYHLNETKYIDKSCISHVIFASFSYPPNLFRPLIDELYSTLGPDHAKIIVNRLLGLLEIQQGSVRADHFITTDPREGLSHVLMKAPVKLEDRCPQVIMKWQQCHRPGMEDYFEIFTEYERPKRTKLHLPMACQLRTVAAIELSRFLHERFPFTGVDSGGNTHRANPRLVGVFRDQILFWHRRAAEG